MTTKIHAAAFNFRGLPLEVRNEIYGYIVGKEYNFLWPGYRAEAYIGNVDDTAMAPVGRMDLVVLCVSKDMKAEAMPVLHLKGLLSYQIDFGYEKFGILHPSTQILTDNMRNIQLDMQMVFALDKIIGTRHARCLRKLSKATLEQFSGSTKLREMLVVRFTHYIKACWAILRSPFFRALEGMTGFETVIPQINSPRLTTETHGNPPIVLLWKTCVSNLDERTRNYVYTNYDAALNAMSKRLEHALGPSQAIADALLDENFDYARYIEFHPRTFLAIRTYDEAARVSEEADRMKGRRTA